MSSSKKASSKPPMHTEVISEDNDFNMLDMYQNLEDYEFRCESVLVIPNYRIYKKETNRMVTDLTNIRLVIHTGTLPADYSDEFFKLIVKKGVPRFCQQIEQEAVKNNIDPRSLKGAPNVNKQNAKE